VEHGVSPWCRLPGVDGRGKSDIDLAVCGLDVDGEEEARSSRVGQRPGDLAPSGNAGRRHAGDDGLGVGYLSSRIWSLWIGAL
jgi:hypothetical protein